MVTGEFDTPGSEIDKEARITQLEAGQVVEALAIYGYNGSIDALSRSKHHFAKLADRVWAEEPTPEMLEDARGAFQKILDPPIDVDFTDIPGVMGRFIDIITSVAGGETSLDSDDVLFAREISTGFRKLMRIKNAQPTDIVGENL